MACIDMYNYPGHLVLQLQGKTQMLSMTLLREVQCHNYRWQSASLYPPPLLGDRYIDMSAWFSPLISFTCPDRIEYAN